jgi:hypothetical protein
VCVTKGEFATFIGGHLGFVGLAGAEKRGKTNSNNSKKYGYTDKKQERKIIGGH